MLTPLRTPLANMKQTMVRLIECRPRQQHSMLCGCRTHQPKTSERRQVFEFKINLYILKYQISPNSNENYKKNHSKKPKITLHP